MARCVFRLFLAPLFGLSLLVVWMPTAGAVNVHCASSVAATSEAGQTVCFTSDPAIGLSQVTPTEQPAGATTLIFSDDPEYVPGPGILYQDTVSPQAGQPQNFRVYFYHVDPSDATSPLYVSVVLTNNGTSMAHVTLTRWGLGGPSSNYLTLGKLTVQQWLADDDSPVTMTIAPGTSAFLDALVPLNRQIETTPIEPGQAVNGIFDGTTDAPIEVTVAAQHAPIGSPDFIDGLSPLPLSPNQPIAMRGTFPDADEYGSYTLTLSGSGQLIYHMADTGSYLTGYDALDGNRSVVDYGNYGVLYHEQLAVHGVGARAAFALVLLPHGGNFTTAVDLSSGLLSAEAATALPIPSDNQFLPPYTYGSVLNEYCLAANGTTSTDMEWMPAAGSFLPVDLWLDPLGTVPAGCGPALTALSSASGLPGSTLTLTGTGFGTQPGDVQIAVGGGAAISVAGAAADWSDTAVTISIPRNLPPGQATVQVYSAATHLLSAPLPFTVTAPPTPPSLGSVSPATVEVGEPLTLLGTGFGITGSVAFNQGTAAPLLVTGGAWTDTTVQSVVPAGLNPGTVTVAIYNASTGLTGNSLPITLVPSPVIAVGAVPAAQVGTPFTLDLTATQGLPPDSWSVAAGALPAGLTLQTTTGVVSGVPRTAGTDTLDVRVRDTAGGADTVPLTISVAPAPPTPVAAGLSGSGGVAGASGGATEASGATAGAAGAAGTGGTGVVHPTTGGTAVATDGSGAVDSHTLPSSALPAASHGGSASAQVGAVSPGATPSPGATTGGGTAVASGVATSASASASGSGVGLAASLTPAGIVQLTASARRIEEAVARASGDANATLDLTSGTLPEEATLVLPPAAVNALLGSGKGLTVRIGPTSLTLPADDLAVSGQGASHGVATRSAALASTLTLRFRAAWVGSGAKAWSAGAPAGAQVSLASPVYRLQLSRGTGRQASSLPLAHAAVVRLAVAGRFAPDAPLLSCYREPTSRAAAQYIPTQLAVAGAAAVSCAAAGSGTYAVLETRVPFSDMQGSWAATDVAVAAAHRIVEGVGDGRFQPNGIVSRAAFAQMLTRALALPADPAAAAAFADVPAHQWYTGAVGAVAHAGLMEGFSPTMFDPLAPVTREQAAVILSRLLADFGARPTATVRPFVDAAAIDAWARPGVMEAASVGLVDGFPGGSFRPALVLTRAQAAALFVRLLALGLPTA